MSARPLCALALFGLVIKLKVMFVLNPDMYSLPAYRIGPFRTCDVGFNHQLPVSNAIDNYFLDRFGGRRFCYSINGRTAIEIALLHYNLSKEDVVTILTTTHNFYISGCVTRAVEKFCKWSRKIENGTKVIFVNHEFGYPYGKLLDLKKYGLPIIEDCATTFFSWDDHRHINTVGDYVIYSFPKFFPLQVGGLLLCNRPINEDLVPRIDPALLQYTKNVMSHYIRDIDAIIETRMRNYRLIRGLLAQLGLPERFPTKSQVVPSVFMFRKGMNEIDLPSLKKYLYAHGIQCSVFYGEEAFFIPSHQALTPHDIQYFADVIGAFIKASDDGVAKRE